jgi:hypothetical protein
MEKQHLEEIRKLVGVADVMASHDVMYLSVAAIAGYLREATIHRRELLEYVDELQDYIKTLTEIAREAPTPEDVYQAWVAGADGGR